MTRTLDKARTAAKVMRLTKARRSVLLNLPKLCGSRVKLGRRDRSALIPSHGRASERLLMALVEKGLLRCIAPKRTGGRIYEMTPLGWEVKCELAGRCYACDGELMGWTWRYHCGERYRVVACKRHSDFGAMAAEEPTARPPLPESKRPQCGYCCASLKPVPASYGFIYGYGYKAEGLFCSLKHGYAWAALELREQRSAAVEQGRATS